MPSIPSQDATAPAEPCERRTRRLTVVLRWTLGLLLAAWSVLLAAWLILQWGILPRIETWRPELEARASQVLGLTVRVGQVRVQSGGWMPTIELRDVVLLDPQDPQGREALRLPRVVAVLSARTMLHWRPHFEQLHIDGPRLEVRRDAEGRLFVAGLRFGSPVRDEADDGAVADWFFAQPEFVIRGGSLRWIDDKRGLPPMELQQVDLVVRNRPGLGRRHHELRLDATPPAEWGERLSLRGRFTQPLVSRHGLVPHGQWRTWRGTVYAELPAADVQSLKRHVDLPFQLASGHGALRAWVEVRSGEPRSVVADVALRDVEATLGADLQPLRFERIDGRLSGERLNDTLAVAGRGLGFTTGDGVVWPSGDFSLRWRHDDAGAMLGGELSAQRLDLAVLAQIASRVPLGEPLRRSLQELQPSGVAGPLSARWDGPLDAPQRYRVQGRLAGMSMAAQPLPPEWGGSMAPVDLPASAPRPGHWAGRPGLRNADIELTATEQGGDARLSLVDGALEFPGVFEEPVVALDRLSATVNWRLSQTRREATRQLDVNVKGLRFANADAEGEFDAAWRTGAGSGHGRGQRLPGILDLSGKLMRARATAIARYLPLGIPESTRHYVARAVQGGTASAVQFRVKGDLADFPFGQPAPAVAGAAPPPPLPGEFRIAARIENARLAYMPGEPNQPPGGEHGAWPAFDQLRGELVFDRRSMEIRNASARLGDVGSGGFELHKVNGGIRQLDHDATLSISGQGRGPLADALRYVQHTPVARWIGGALDTATGSGSTELQLSLNIPLSRGNDTTVAGRLQLAGNDVRLRPDVPLLAAARARIDFTRESFAVTGGAARVLGGDLQFEGGQPAGGVLRLSGQGGVSAEGLRRATELGPLARLAGQMSGQTSYRLGIAFPQGRPQVDLSSSLSGLALDLPAPLRKPAEQALPLELHVAPLADAQQGGGRDQLRFSLGQVVQANYLRDVSGSAPTVLRGGVGIGEAAPAPPAGVSAVVQLASLDLDAWQAVLDRVQGSASAASGDAGAAGPHNAYLPAQIAVRTQELKASGRRLTRVVAGLSEQDGVWRANVEADQLSGHAEYTPPGRVGGEAGRVYARLARLSLPRSEVEAVESMLDPSPSSMPALDIVVDDFELRGKHLGRVEVEASNRAAAVGGTDGAREWRLTKLNLIAPEARLTATGQWGMSSEAGAARGGGAPPRRRAVMDFKLDLADSGAFLTRLQLPGTLRGGKGKLSGQVAWLGSPLSPDYASLAGNVQIAIDEGQFLKAEAGAAKLLSVLSLQSLPRRFLLDFRDVFQEGFSFDNISGHVNIANGVAHTNNLRMRGVQAVVLMEGQADIGRETQDLRVWVVPEINAGAASLAYAVINPAIGLGTFLGQLFLRRPLIEAGTREFKVTGSWTDPKVDRVERKAGDAVPSLEPPPAASGPAR